MKLILYTISSDEKEMFKGPEYIDQLDNIQWKAATSILNPVFTFHKGGRRWKEFNYVRLKWTGMQDRWYYVQNLIMQEGGIVEIHCREDVRFTWRSWIMKQFFLVARQEFINDKTIQDNRKVIPMTRQIDSVGVTSGPGVVGDAGDGTIILTVSG